MRKTRHRGRRRVGWVFPFIAAALTSRVLPLFHARLDRIAGESGALYDGVIR